MFIDFANLKHTKDIVLPVNADACGYAFSEMFSGTSIEDAPVICPAPSRSFVAQGTYSDMFLDCNNLKYAVVVTDQAIASESTQGEGYDVFELGSFGSNVTPAYLIVKQSQTDHVKEAVEASGLSIIVLGYDSTNDTACYSTEAETFCLRMAAKYSPQESYDEGYDAGYADGEASASIDPASQLVTDSSKWQVYDFAVNNWTAFETPPSLNVQPIDSMDVEWYTELMNLDSVDVLIVDKFNPSGSVDVITGTQDVTITYQRNDPEDPNTNAYISADIVIEAGESVGLSFADLADNGDIDHPEQLLVNIYWSVEDNISNNHWIITAEETGTYNIRLDANGNGGCTMTITEPEPEP